MLQMKAPTPIQMPSIVREAAIDDCANGVLFSPGEVPDAPPGNPAELKRRRVRVARMSTSTVDKDRQEILRVHREWLETAARKRPVEHFYKVFVGADHLVRWCRLS